MVLTKLTPTQKEMFKYLTIGLLYSYEEIAEYIGMNKTNINKQCKALIENGYMVKLNSRPVKVRLIKNFELTNITNKGTKTKVKNDTSGLLDKNKITPDKKEEKLKCTHGIELGKHCYLCDKRRIPGIAKNLKKFKKGNFNPSIELNLIKSLYANRFGTTTNMQKDQMINKMIKAWRVI